MKERKKLVRDLIPMLVEQSGKKSVFYEAGEEEFRLALHNKLREEIEELISSEEIEEIADVIEVLLALIELYKFDSKEIEKIRMEKKEKRGGFSKRYILEY